MKADWFEHRFQVERQVHGYAVVLRVTGEVDALTARELGREIAIGLALATPPAPVVVDLGEVGFFAAAGLNELHRGHMAAKAAGVPLRVVARHRHVLRPFQVAMPDPELTPWPTVREALAVRTSTADRRYALPL